MKRTDRYRTISSIQRYGEDLCETIVLLDPETRTISLSVSKQQEEETRIGEEILRALRTQEEDTAKGEPLTEAQINDEVEGRNAYKRSALRALVTAKKVTRLGKGGKNDPFKYCLANSRFFVPSDSRGHGDKNPKNDPTPYKSESYSCPHTSSIPDDSTESRGQESATWEEEL